MRMRRSERLLVNVLPSTVVTLLKSKSGISVSELQLLNMLLISVTADVSNTGGCVIDEQALNILLQLVNAEDVVIVTARRELQF